MTRKLDRQTDSRSCHSFLTVYARGSSAAAAAWVDWRRTNTPRGRGREDSWPPLLLFAGNQTTVTAVNITKEEGE